jgi:ArsR family transcriptional regulator
MPFPGPRAENPSEVLYEHHAEMCKVFSHPTRLRILNILRERELSVATIARELGVLLGTVSPHLLMMRRRRVLVSRKQENRVFYRLANPKMLHAFDLIREILCEQLRKEGLLVREIEQAGARKLRGHGD